MDRHTDVLIIGSGCAGLYCALHLPRDRKVTIITKKDVESSDSFLAQGGMCMLKNDEDYDSYFEDTMKAGHYENDRRSVDIMIRSSRDVAQELLDLGVRFTRDENGNLEFTREGAHSHHRILFYKDITGREITEKLWEAVKKLPNVEILEYTTMVDLITRGNCCYGAVIRDDTGDDTIGSAQAPDNDMSRSRVQRIGEDRLAVFPESSGKTDPKRFSVITADYTMLATGGLGGLYRHSTNFRHLRADSVAIALEHDIEVKNIDYIQIHPTTFYSEKPEDRSFLISESVRGEGAHLLDKNMNRFVNELLPRDLLTIEIRKQMKKDGTRHVWEDLRSIPEEEVRQHFPNIVEHCAQQGYDVFREPIPVVPAQHYYMGGIKVDYNGATSMKHLYASGETACNGVHGRNRLASNSLLESLVWARLAAGDITRNYRELTCPDSLKHPDLDRYLDAGRLATHYQQVVVDAIEEARQAEDERLEG